MQRRAGAHRAPAVRTHHGPAQRRYQRGCKKTVSEARLGSWPRRFRHLPARPAVAARLPPTACQLVLRTGRTPPGHGSVGAATRPPGLRNPAAAAATAAIGSRRFGHRVLAGPLHAGLPARRRCRGAPARDRPTATARLTHHGRPVGSRDDVRMARPATSLLLLLADQRHVLGRQHLGRKSPVALLLDPKPGGVSSLRSTMATEAKCPTVSRHAPV